MKSFPTLSTARLVLRQLEKTDDVQIAALRSDESVNKYIDRPKQTNAEEAKAFIQKINDSILQGKSFYWAICLTDNPTLIGTVCLWNFSDDRTMAELGYELIPKYQGQGLMNEAVKSIIRFSFHVIKLKALEAYTHKENKNSTRLLEKNNFKLDQDKKSSASTDDVIYRLENFGVAV